MIFTLLATNSCLAQSKFIYLKDVGISPPHIESTLILTEDVSYIDQNDSFRKKIITDNRTFEYILNFVKNHPKMSNLPRITYGCFEITIGEVKNGIPKRKLIKYLNSTDTSKEFFENLHKGLQANKLDTNAINNLNYSLITRFY